MHDHNGSPLKVGDKVMIPCVVKHLNDGCPNYCNVTVETEHGRRPDGQKDQFCSINTAQLVLVERAPE